MRVAESAPPYGRPPEDLPERALWRLWQKRAARQHEFRTQQGRRVRVLFPGRTGVTAGPDFRAALLEIEGLGLVRGDVEIHRSAQDWDAHGHTDDPNYSGVALHAALEPLDAATPNTPRPGGGGEIPIISLAPLLSQPDAEDTEDAAPGEARGNDAPEAADDEADDANPGPSPGNPAVKPDNPSPAFDGGGTKAGVPGLPSGGDAAGLNGANPGLAPGSVTAETASPGLLSGSDATKPGGGNPGPPPSGVALVESVRPGRLPGNDAIELDGVSPGAAPGGDAAEMDDGNSGQLPGGTAVEPDIAANPVPAPGGVAAETDNPALPPGGDAMKPGGGNPGRASGKSAIKPGVNPGPPPGKAAVKPAIPNPAPGGAGAKSGGPGPAPGSNTAESGGPGPASGGNAAVIPGGPGLPSGSDAAESGRRNPALTPGNAAVKPGLPGLLSGGAGPTGLDAYPPAFAALWGLLAERGFPPPASASEAAALLDRAGDARFAAKARLLARFIAEQPPQQTLYEALLEGLGYRVNQAPFLRLAQQAPYAALAQAAGRVLEPQRPAALAGWLLAAAGLDGAANPSLPPGFGEPVLRREWALFRVRPANHPARRIKGAGKLLARFLSGQNPPGLYKGLAQAAAAGRPSTLTAALTVEAAAGEPTAPIGAGRARDLAVNVVLPFLYAINGNPVAGPIGKNPPPESPSSESPPPESPYLAMYRQFPSLPPNEVIRQMGEELLPAPWRKTITGARRQQGLLHLAACLRGAGSGSSNGG